MFLYKQSFEDDSDTIAVLFAMIFFYLPEFNLATDTF